MIDKKNLGLILLVIIISFFLCFGFFYLFKINNPFQRKELKIDNTQILIDDIKVIAQLFTFSYYTEIVIDSTKKIDGIFYDNNHQVIIIGRGTSYIGTDLSGLDTSKIEVNRNSNTLECVLTVPKAKIFNTVINPSGFTIFKDCSKFSPKEIQNLKTSAISKIEKNAIESGVLDKANNRTKKLFQDLLLGIGFSKVTILIK